MKAILAIDVEEYGEYYVDVYRKDAGDRFVGRYYLKPMPMKKSIELACQKEDDGNEYGAGLIVGWNDCIDEITGETE